MVIGGQLCLSRIRATRQTLPASKFQNILLFQLQSRPTFHARSGRVSGVGFCRGFGQEFIQLPPEPLPSPSFGLGELREFGGIADASEIGILLPMLQGLGDECLCFGWAGLQQSRPGCQFGGQPLESMFAEPGLGVFVERWFVLAQGRGGERCRAGGVVAVLHLSVVGQLGIGLQSRAPEPRGQGIASRVVGSLGQGQPFGVILRGLAVGDRGQAGVEGLELWVAGLEFGELALGLGSALGVVQTLACRAEAIEVVRKELAIHRITGIGGQGLALPHDGLLQLLTGLGETARAPIDQRHVVKRPAHVAGEVG